jgi:uncharacterized protein (DUF2237 family)
VLMDDSGDKGGGRGAPRNVLGEPLDVCSVTPMTGFYRDGCCNTGQEDIGSHTVCAVMTAAFLDFSKSRGNDLSTPSPAAYRWPAALKWRACHMLRGAAARSRSRGPAPSRAAHG